MATTIVTKNGTGAPTDSDLVAGELAVDLTNGRLYTTDLDSGGTVLELGTNPASDVTFGDNTKAIFGAGSDLQIFHDASDSYIKDEGTGNLYLTTNGSTMNLQAGSDNMVKIYKDAQVEIFHDASVKLATTATGIDVTGTVTADGLTVDKSGGNIAASFINSDSNNSYIQFQNLTTGTTTYTDGSLVGIDSDESLTIWQLESNHIKFGTSATERMRIDSSGRQLIGYTSSVGTAYQTNLQVKGSSASNYGGLGVISTNNEMLGVVGTWSNGENSLMIAADPDNLRPSSSIVFTTDATERMRINASGNVGINASSPSSATWSNFLQVEATYPGVVYNSTAGGTNYKFSTGVDDDKWLIRDETAAATRLTVDASGNVGIGNSSAVGKLEVYANNTAPAAYIRQDGTGPIQSWHIAAGAEKMRLDASGNLLVGKTSANSSITGVQILPEGDVGVTRDGSHALLLNRLTSDGDIAIFRKDGTTVGSIGSRAGEFIAVGSGDTYLEFNFGSDQINPSSGTASRDDAIDLGSSGARFDDIYATNGTIQTSDRNEKQDIEALSDAEQRVAVAAKGLLRKFRWISSVEEKGDEARTHFGIIAQDLQAAFAAEGLDAGDYAMFINSTWTDEETGEERTRLGVRYHELLAFIIAAI